VTATPRLTTAEWATAQQACTQAQLQALIYWRDGYGYKRISKILGIRRDAVRGRIDRALETIREQEAA
jgi:DNA-directed RNA polymerase specialized sigma24 family protein